jgi:hypothetical protein
MLPAWFVVFAAAIRLTSGLSYAWAVIKRRARPNPITWFFWALTPTIVFSAQLLDHGGWELANTFALGFGPLVVFILSLRHNLTRAQFTTSTIMCGILAAIGVVLWLSTSNPMLAIIFSILADICASIPTILKARFDPSSEFLPGYLITMVSATIALLAVNDWRFSHYAFPAYIFVINAVIYSTGLFSPWLSKKRSKVKRLTSARR